MFLVHNSGSPQCSQNTNLLIHETRFSSWLTLPLWSALGPSIHNLATADFVAIFFKRLKTHLFINMQNALGALLSDFSEEKLYKYSITLHYIFQGLTLMYSLVAYTLMYSVVAYALMYLVVPSIRQLLSFNCKLWRLFSSAQEALPSWDKQIQSLCFQVNGILEKIVSAAPMWIAKSDDHQMT